MHDPFAGIVPPVRVTDEASDVTAPPQVVVGVPDTVMPLGKASVSGAVSGATLEFGLLSVIVSVEVAPASIVAGLNALPSSGATPVALEALTVSVANAGPALFPLLVCNAPAASELTKLPPFAAVTSTVMVHAPFEGIEPPVTVTDVVLAVTTPPQVVAGAPAIRTPPGKLSVSGAAMFATVLSPLLSVMVSSDVSPASIVDGLKALPSVGGVAVCGTVSVATAGAALLPLLVCKAPAAIELM